MARTQESVVLAHLETAPLTQREAAVIYGIYRLSDKVFKLRRAGHNIRTEMKRVKTRTGRGYTHIAVYHLEENGEANEQQ